MNRPLTVVLVPFSGGGRDPGPQTGPDALVELGLLTCLSENHQVRCRDVSRMYPSWPSRGMQPGRVFGADDVEAMSRLAGAEVFAAHRLSQVAVVIGGDHSISLGTVSQPHHPDLYPGSSVGLLWIDAHYDAHTISTTHSKYANGLPFAAALGRGSAWCASHMRTPRGWRRLRYAPQDVLHVGAGELDCEKEEVQLLDELGVMRVTMHGVHTRGMAHLRSAVENFLQRHDKVVVSIDLDAIHSRYAPGVSFPNQTGLHPFHLGLIGEMVSSHGGLIQIEVMEYNPVRDIEQKTGILAIAILETFLQKKHPQ